jgi:tetratricopeptide (TPR) repeat protein
MSRDTVKNLFIVPSMRGFYQQLFTGIGSYQELGNRVIRQIKAAHAFRQIEQVRELSSLLLNFPIKEYQLIAQYYLYWCRYRNREYDIDSLEVIIDHTQAYKAQALLTRGTLEYDNRRNREAFYFYSEALKARPNVSEYIAISRAIAVAKAVDGFHNLALNDLEKVLPLIKHAEPRLYFDFLNSYAVELGEAGRLQEARNVSSLVLASPFIHAYPEWQETHAELSLKQKNHSSVTVPCLPKQQPKPRQVKPKDNVIKFPTAKKPPTPDEDEFGIALAPLQALGLILTAVLGDRITEDEVEKICNNYYRVIMDWYS